MDGPGRRTCVGQRRSRVRKTNTPISPTTSTPIGQGLLRVLLGELLREDAALRRARRQVGDPLQADLRAVHVVPGLDDAHFRPAGHRLQPDHFAGKDAGVLFDANGEPCRRLIDQARSDRDVAHAERRLLLFVQHRESPGFTSILAHRSRFPRGRCTPAQRLRQGFALARHVNSSTGYWTHGRIDIPALDIIRAAAAVG